MFRADCCLLLGKTHLCTISFCLCLYLLLERAAKVLGFMSLAPAGEKGLEMQFLALFPLHDTESLRLYNAYRSGVAQVEHWQPGGNFRNSATTS